MLVAMTQQKEGLMNRNYAFGELAQALEVSRQADNVVLALAKIEHGRDLAGIDVNALRFAVDFLQEVHYGSRWLSQDQPVINQDSARTMSSFVRAAESLSSTQSLVDNIDELLRSAQAVDAGTADPAQLTRLRTFFGSILKNTLDQVDRSFTPSDILTASA
jgi:hypothetical protein